MILKKVVYIVYLCYDKFLKAPVAQDIPNLITIRLKENCSCSFLFLRARSGYILDKDIYVVQAYYIHNIEMEHEIVHLATIGFIEKGALYGELSQRFFITEASFSRTNFEYYNHFNFDASYSKISTDAIFVHCDLKPEDILLSKEGSIKDYRLWDI